jgi:ATP-dependent RNA helicase DeaD
MSKSEPTTASFRDLELPGPLLAALDEVGYETPSPIQAQAIPHLLKGLDLLGHAPTGTGKTAAFALPLLSRLDIKSRAVQVMTLTPTRELAIQVAEAFQRYASHIPGFNVLPIYGGQEYGVQLRQLRRGVHVVVGTPGRVMDHMRKGTLKLDGLQALVLDEADEMLRMGFIDEVEWILDQAPKKRQMALFSATMPKEIERIARRHLDKPQEISIKSKTATAETIRQRYWQVSGLHKLDALTRILEVEPFDAILMFVRTKTATTELAERLEARGYAAAAMNGDMIQKQREQMVERLKKGSLDILVATDVAARGLDVDRISHVINYDIPYDAEAYIHRIGRTGRAGRKGDAILFVAPRERRMLHSIERATRQKITPLQLPTTETVNNKRIGDFKQKITDTLGAGELAFMQGLVEQYQQEHDVPAVEIAAALASMFIGDRPLLMKHDSKRPERTHSESKPRNDRGERRRRQPDSLADEDKERYRIEVGHQHGVKPGNIVGAIANEAGLDGGHIGQIEIDSDFSLVDLPVGMPNDILADLRKVRVCGEPLNISRLDKNAPETKGRSSRPSTKKSASRPRSGKRDDAGPRSRKKDESKKRDDSGPRSRKKDESKSAPKKRAGPKSGAPKSGGSKFGAVKKAGSKAGARPKAKLKTTAGKKSKSTLSVEKKGSGRPMTRKRTKPRG